MAEEKDFPKELSKNLTEAMRPIPPSTQALLKEHFRWEYRGVVRMPKAK